MARQPALHRLRGLCTGLVAGVAVLEPASGQAFRGRAPSAGRHEVRGDIDARRLGPGPGSEQRRGAVTASRVQDFQSARYTRSMTSASPLERMHRAMRVACPSSQGALFGFTGSLP